MKAYVNRNAVLKYLSYSILLLGVLLRVCIYLQNRNLFLDEANVARNIYERSFVGLLHPLSYYQYAPPVFLWLLKALSSIAGYSEYVFRFIPLISGVGSLFLLYLLLDRYRIKKVAWYPLFLFATGLIYLRYATEVKQYSSDCMIALCLIYLALSVDWRSMSRWGFLLLWALVGSIATWSSMPSVFILAGVGAYYACLFYSSRDYSNMSASIVVLLIWLIQFLAYYILILKPQISSDYLQNFHKESFLYPIPHSRVELSHNWLMTIDILKVAAGFWLLSVLFHGVAIFMAIYVALRSKSISALLLIVPIILLFFAAVLHQYALTPRIILFDLPLVLILIASGFEQFMSYRFVRIPLIIVSLICLYNFSELSLFYKPLKIQETTGCMDFLVAEQISGSSLYVDPTAFPMYTYYSEIHPCSARWKTIKGGRLGTDGFVDSISLQQARVAVLYGCLSLGEMNEKQQRLNMSCAKQKHHTDAMTEVFIFARP